MKDSKQLAALGTAELLQLGAAKRDQAFGHTITYSPKVFLPLTMACRDRCGYCTFAKPPSRLTNLYMTMEQMLDSAEKGASAGCHEALFTLGEAPEARYRRSAEWLAHHGYESTVEYLTRACATVQRETGLLAHSNAGALSKLEIAKLRTVTVSQGSMVETLRDDLAAHAHSPDKSPARRLSTLYAAGELAVPFTTGILVGIGEDELDRIAALEAIALAHAKHGHVQEVIVQNFLPKPGTPMSSFGAPTLEAHARAIALARLVLPSDVHVQAPPNLASDMEMLIRAGIDDWGGISPITKDYVNPERPWPSLNHLRQVTQDAGFALVPRLAAYPEDVMDPNRWFDPSLHAAVLAASDSEGYARDHPWVAGGSVEPPIQLCAPSTSNVTPRFSPSSFNPELAKILRAAVDGRRPSEDEIVTLFSARGEDLDRLIEVADELRKKTNGDVVTWVANRNINYTNICTFGCKFCAFSRGPRSLGLRGAPYLLDMDEISRRVQEAVNQGATEVCLQGGIHPTFDAQYYVEVLRAVRRGSSSVHIHAFTALEIWEAARRSEEPVESYLTRLKEAGLRTLPGTAAEILDDKVRAVLCSDKINSQTWLNVHRAAHKVGLRSNVTIMFGSVEGPASWAKHLVATSQLQQETGGFTEFVPLPFVHMAAPIYLQGKSRKGPTFREAILMHAVGRIAYQGLIDNIQASWVKLGLSGASQLLASGCNDLGGTLMDENISRAAGAAHGQGVTEVDFLAVAQPMGRQLRQRSTLYEPILKCPI